MGQLECSVFPGFPCLLWKRLLLFRVDVTWCARFVLVFLALLVEVPQRIAHFLESFWFVEFPCGNWPGTSGKVLYFNSSVWNAVEFLISAHFLREEGGKNTDFVFFSLSSLFLLEDPRMEFKFSTLWWQFGRRLSLQLSLRMEGILLRLPDRNANPCFRTVNSSYLAVISIKPNFRTGHCTDNYQVEMYIFQQRNL